MLFSLGIIVSFKMIKTKTTGWSNQWVMGPQLHKEGLEDVCAKEQRKKKKQLDDTHGRYESSG